MAPLSVPSPEPSLIRSIPPSHFRARRERLLASMGEDALFFPAAPERPRNRDTHHPYRQDSHLLWLCGFPEPDSAVALVGGERPRHILFCREKDESREIWDGFRFGPEAALDAFGFDEAHPIDRLDEVMASLLDGAERLLAPLGADPAWDARMLGWIRAVRDKARSGSRAPQGLLDARAWIEEARLFKDPREADLLRRSAAIADAAHKAAMLSAAPGKFEYEIEAEILREIRRGGASAPAYQSIVASGEGACVLHYVANDRRIQDGDLLLIDAGAELCGYASDITRTFPANGRFTGPQRDLHDLVLAAQAAAMERVRPGSSWRAPHEAAVAVLAQGMLDFGLLRGSLQEALETQSYRRFYMHNTGHWLGLDVHDAGEYKAGGDWRPLEPGMCLTVEPGIYVRSAEDVPEAFRGIGIRIEDDLLVTAEGHEILTDATPRSADAIESFMRRE